MSVTLHLSGTIYPRQSVEKAIADYKGICSVELASGQNGLTCKITCLQQPEEKTVVHEFLNYLLNLSVEEHVCLR
jgi:hypothetical protein